MPPVLHQHLPDDMRSLRPLPGVAPVTGAWLREDEAYGGQMALRRQLIAQRRADVLHAGAEAAVAELYAEITTCLPGLGFLRTGSGWLCPDQIVVPDHGDLGTIGQLCQADFCVLERTDADEHVLRAAVLCFPASWRLDEKIGRPLTAIHGPVAEYDAGLARRVQRLFDGVKAGRPIWRFNRLWYSDPALFQPRSETEPRPDSPQGQAYLRCERQVILRLPRTGAVVFAIHSYVLPRDRVPKLD